MHDYEFISANPLDHTGGRRDREETRRSYRLLNDLLFVVRRRLHIPAVTRWIAVSHALAAKHEGRGLSFAVLPNFVTNGAAATSTTRDGVFFVGRLTAEKGVHEVIALARALPTIRVSVAGWGPLAHVVETACEELPNLSFAGRVEPSALQPLFQTARVTVVPSLWEEPGALSVLESMAAGTPLVAYRKAARPSTCGTPPRASSSSPIVLRSRTACGRCWTIVTSGRHALRTRAGQPPRPIPRQRTLSASRESTRARADGDPASARAARLPDLSSVSHCWIVRLPLQELRSDVSADGGDGSSSAAGGRHAGTQGPAGDVLQR